ncbi:MAG: ComF family protein [Vicinamibacteraceae bacterium]
MKKRAVPFFPFFARAIDSLLTVLLAPRCVACEELLDQPRSSLVCPRCWSRLAVFTRPVCESCGLPVLAASRCGPCAVGKLFAHITRLRTVGPYDGTLRRILHALKYDGRRTLAAELGPLLRRHSTDLLEGADLVAPVPLHARRMRERGFNQAADLASTLPLPHLDALARVVATGSQTGLSAEQRRRNVSRAFALRPETSRVGRTRAASMESPTARIRDRVVVLVDDVCTTGATLEACAAVLLEAGAREVRAVTVARALLTSSPSRPHSAPALR